MSNSGGVQRTERFGWWCDTVTRRRTVCLAAVIHSWMEFRHGRSGGGRRGEKETAAPSILLRPPESRLA